MQKKYKLYNQHFAFNSTIIYSKKKKIIQTHETFDRKYFNTLYRNLIKIKILKNNIKGIQLKTGYFEFATNDVATNQINIA